MATILIVDDDDQILSMLQDMLQRHGHRILTAGNGLQALEVAEEQPSPVDMLITDIQMPGMSGPQLVERFKLRFPPAKVLYVSASELPQTIRDQVTKGSATFLKKSGTLRLLVATVEQILGSSFTDPRTC